MTKKAIIVGAGPAGLTAKKDTKVGYQNKSKNIPPQFWRSYTTAKGSGQTGSTDAGDPEADPHLFSP